MNKITYRDHVDPATAWSLSIPGTAYKHDMSEYMVRKLAMECGALLKIHGIARVEQETFDAYLRTFVVD